MAKGKPNRVECHQDEAHIGHRIGIGETQLSAEVLASFITISFETILFRLDMDYIAYSHIWRILQNFREFFLIK